MALTISGTTLTGVNIDTTTDNPITILPSAYLFGAGDQSGLAINGNINWTVTNSGRINGFLFGVYLGNLTAISNGTFINSVIGQIGGGIIVDGTATIENAGEMSAGIDDQNGSVANLSTGTISGETGGIRLGTGSVTNAGLISSTGGAVEVTGGASVTNLIGGTLAAGTGGSCVLAVNEPATITNAGLISGYEAVDLDRGGSVTNQSSGVIRGSTFGIYSYRYLGGTYTANVINGGLVTAIQAIYLKDGGTVSNLPLADIAGSSYGISIKNNLGSVTNAGSISGAGVAGILIAGGGVSNQAGGAISGPIGVYGYLGSSVTVTNTGLIAGAARYGVWLRGGGGVTNQSTGLITGNTDGIFGGGTIFNAGTIEGSAYAIDFYARNTDRLIVAPGAVFSGKVNGGNPVGDGFISSLEFDSAASAGQVAGLGTEFTNFAQFTVDSGAQWTFSGTNTLAPGTALTDLGALTIFDGSLTDAGSVIDSGVLREDAASLTVGTLSGAGELLIGGGSTLMLGGAAAGIIDFAGTGLLALVPSKFSGQINGLGGGGRIELSGISDATSASVINGNTLAIQQSAGPALDLTLDPTQSYAGMVFPVTTLGGVQFVDTSEQVGPTVISQGETNTVTGAAASVLATISGGVGGVTVTGASSLLNVTTGVFIVGDAGSGNVSIEAGGTAQAQDGVVVADSSGASGSSVEVSGAAADFDVIGSVILGAAGEGSLAVSQGAQVEASSIDEASVYGGDGIVSVAGAGSALTLTGSLTVGDQGAGEVSILSAATVSALSVTIGSANSLSSGNVDVEGTGSELLIGTGGVLNVGVAGGGSGVLTIGAGTTLRSNAGVVEAGHASFNNNGGVVDPPFVDLTTQSNSGLGSNLYDLYVENIGAVQIVSGTGTWDTPMLLTGTSISDAANNINVNGDQGEWQLSSNGTLIVNANTIDSGQAIVFEDATDTLIIGQIVNNGSPGVGGTAPVVAPGAENLLQAGGFAGEIWGYVAGDKIQFDNMNVSSASVVNGNTVDLFGVGNVSLGSLAFFTKSGSKASNSGAAAAAAQMQCFSEGTRIETVDGPVRVEDLRVGDLVLVADGAAEPIVWIGHRAVSCARHPTPEKVWPVRIAAGSFGENTPVRDLYLSPDHAVFVNEMLVPVKLLINGTTIARMQRSEVTYFHVELPRHAVILAEGLPVESYLDSGDRTDFDGGETIRLFPEFVPVLAPETALVWETRGAASLVMVGEALARARRLVAARGVAATVPVRDGKPVGSRRPMAVPDTECPQRSG